MIRAGDVIQTFNGWQFYVSRVEMWSDADGAVFGRAPRRQRDAWSAAKKIAGTSGDYIGTLRSLSAATKINPNT